jgi:hypothetical protein
MGSLYDKYGTSRAGRAMAGAMAGAGLGKGIVDGINGSKDFCLNPGEASANAVENFFINFGNIAGGLGDVVKGLFPGGGKTPEESMQEQVTDLNQQYRTTFDNFTTAFATAQASFDEDILPALEKMNTTNHAILTYFRLIEDEKIEMNTYRIVFIFILFIVLYIYLLME